MFTHILVRMLYEDWFRFNLYIPVDLIDKNFERAHQKNAILEQKFFFRTNLFSDGQPEIQELSIAEILFGSDKF